MFSRTAPTLVFLLMLACRLVVDWQMIGKEDEEDEDSDIASHVASDDDIATTATKAKTKSKILTPSKKEN